MISFDDFGQSFPIDIILAGRNSAGVLFSFSGFASVLGFYRLG